MSTKSRIRKRWHRFMCWRNRHDMRLYNIGHTYWRQCYWCGRTGFLSEVDQDVIRYRNAQLFRYETADDDDNREII